MGKTPTVTKCKTAKDFEKAVIKQGGQIKNGGRHPKFYNPNTGGIVPYPAHAGEIPIGTRLSIKKMLLAIGFFIFILTIVF